MTNFDRDGLRRSVVARIWSQDLRVEFVDRVVDLVVSGGATTAELDREIQRAQIAVTRNKQGEGGVPSCWMALTRWIKSKYAFNGKPWRPPTGPFEPKPNDALTAFDAPPPDDLSDAAQEEKSDAPAVVVYRNQDGYNLSILTSILTQEQADALTSELACDGKKHTYREIRQIISDYKYGIKPPVDHDRRLTKKLTLEELAAILNVKPREAFDFNAAAKEAAKVA